MTDEHTWGMPSDQLRCPLCGNRDYYPDAAAVARWQALMALVEAANRAATMLPHEPRRKLLDALAAVRSTEG